MEEKSQPLPEAVPVAADQKTEKTPRPRRPRKRPANPKTVPLPESQPAEAQKKGPQLALEAEQINPSSLPAPLASKELAVVEEKFFVPTLTNFSPTQGARPTASSEAKEGQSSKRRRRGGRGRKKSQNGKDTVTDQPNVLPLVASAPLTGAVAQSSLSQPEKSDSSALQLAHGTQQEPTSAAAQDKASRSQKTPAAKAHTGEPVMQGQDVVAVPQETQAASAIQTDTQAADSVSAKASSTSASASNKKQQQKQGNASNKQQTAKAAHHDTPEPAKPAKAVASGLAGRKLLVSVLPDEQVEVVMLQDGILVEYYVEMEHQAKIRGNIYKGTVSNIDVNLQAAFINYGAGKNGFLQIDEVHPEYYLNPIKAAKGHKYPPIQKVMKPGQEVLVQVGKEPTGNKGAFLTTWVSLAGRFLVLTPGQEQIGISRKVEDEEERTRLRELIKGIVPGKDLGAIVRTASSGATKTTIQKDLSFLKRLWKDIRKKATQEKAPTLIYSEPNLAARSVRDYFTEDVVEIWVDDAATAESMKEMVGLLAPRKVSLVKYYEDTRKTLWEHFDVLRQIEQVHAREVHLPSGGRLVFDQTEALMAIDINSGKSGGKSNFESMAFKTNMEAARCIAHQLRMRDIGGQIVVDFIEMRDHNQVREVEKEMRQAMKADRARHDVGKMSSFGLLQIVRQRTGSSAISISTETCPVCLGTGVRRNLEWQAIQALREIHRRAREARESGQCGLVYSVDSELALYLLNNKRQRLVVLEQEFSVTIEVRPARMHQQG